MRSIKSDRVNLVAPASPVHRAIGTVQAWTGKVDLARKFKCILQLPVICLKLWKGSFKFKILFLEINHLKNQYHLKHDFSFVYVH